MARKAGASRISGASSSSLPSAVSSYSLSETSADEFVPPAHLSSASPPYLAWDCAVAAAVFAAVAYASGGSSLAAAALAASRGSDALRALSLALAAAVAVFVGLRRLPEVSHAALLRHEAALLKTVQGDVRHHWTRFQTPGAAWHVHSLLLRSSANAGADAAGGGVRGGKRTRPQLVIIHGHSAGAAHWEAILDRVSAGADVHVLDMPGWGRSPSPEVLARCTSPRLATALVTECVRGWLDANGLERCALMGHSLGGFYAIHVAAAHPERVAQLLLVAPAGLTPLMPNAATLWGFYFKFAPPQLIARLCGRLGYLVFRTLYLAATVEDPRFPDVYYQLAAASAYTGCGDRHSGHFLRVAWSPAAPSQLGLFWAMPCLALLQDIQCDVSILWGQRDDILPPVMGALLHRLRPHTHLYYIHRALHNPAHNLPAAFCDAVLDALARVSGAARAPLAAVPLPPGASPAAAVAAAAALPTRHAHADGSADLLLEPDARPVSLAAVEALAAALASEATQGAEARVSGSRSGANDSSSSRAAPASSPTGALPAHGGGELPATRPRRGSSAAAGGGLSRRRGPSAAAAGSAPEGALAPVGRGRGYCLACFHRVQAHKAYWRCGCGAWAFNAHILPAQTAAHWAAQLAFFDELFVYGTFNARTSRTCRLRPLTPASPLPRPHPPAATAALQAALALEAPGGGDQGRTPAQAEDSARGRRRRGGGGGGAHEAAADRAALAAPALVQGAGRTRGGGPSSWGELGLPPAPGTLQRGDALLLG